MRFYRTLACALALLAGPAPAMACGLVEVIAGTCPTDEIQVTATSSGGIVDKGVLRRQQMWTNFPEFSGNPSGDITLRVCGFLASPANSDIRTIDFSGDQQGFIANMRIVEDAVQDWVIDSPADNVESRLVFELRGADGGFNTCTRNARDFHIKIAFNAKGRNNSQVGLLSASANPSMNLDISGTGNNRVARRTVLHEFGHALGLGHEMMHRQREPCMRNFDAGLWIADFQRRTGRLPFGDLTPEEQVEAAKRNIEVIVRAMQGLELTTTTDDQSIMTYPIPAAGFRRDGARCEMVQNRKLSGPDRAIILTNYGRLAQ